MIELRTINARHRHRAEGLRRLFELLHWGNASGRVYMVEDPLVPDTVQMGVLEALRVNVDGRELEVPYTGHLGVEYDLPAMDAGLAVERLFDDNRVQRLHLIAPGQGAIPQSLLDERMHAAEDLNRLAAAVGGRQARFAYPRVRAVPVAEVSHVVYGTDKKGDGYSHYIHAFSEETRGPRPWLAIDVDGRSWLVGGSYTVPPEGITD